VRTSFGPVGTRPAALLTAALLALGYVAAPTHVAASTTDAAIGFVHVEANVGGASGGHTALRLGDRAYHFQLGDERLLILVREDWGLFRFRYNVLQNRPLHVAHVPVEAATLRRVRDHFTGVHLSQARERHALASRRRDAAALEFLLGQRAGVPTPGAGLFDPSASSPPWATALARRLDASLGPGWLDAEIAGLEARLAAAPDAGSPIVAWREHLSLREALRVLRDAHPLADAAALPAGEAPLRPAERASLERLAASLEASIERLLRAGPPDRAFPLFVALARHRAVWRSLASARLVLVDPFPDAAPLLGARAVRSRRQELAAIAEYLEERVTQTRAAFVDGSAPLEPELARLEALAARAREYRRGAEHGHAVREPMGTLVPQRARALAVDAAAPAHAEHGLEELRAEIARREADRAARWHYDLFRDNCVTALAHTLDDAFGGADAMRTELGGHVDPDELLAFWPFVFFGKVAERMAVEQVERIPGHRERTLASLRRGQGGLRGYAREANTLSSTLYRGRDADGSFLLFTDDVVWVRPLYGALNLAWAGADAALGLVTAPFDRGRRLERAAKGALFSFPELAFVNIRKGSFDAASLRPASAGH
jgi:hypothetical protein